MSESEKNKDFDGVFFMKKIEKLIEYFLKTYKNSTPEISIYGYREHFVVKMGMIKCAGKSIGECFSDLIRASGLVYDQRDGSYKEEIKDE